MIQRRWILAALVVALWALPGLPLPANGAPRPRSPDELQVAEAQVKSKSRGKTRRTTRTGSGKRKSKSKVRPTRRGSTKLRSKTKRVAGKQRKRAASGGRADGFGIAELFQGALGLAALGLLLRRRREAQENGGFTPASSASGPYAADPVLLDKSPGIDPATIREDHTVVPLGVNRLSDAAPMLSLDEDDPRRVAAEIDLLTSDAVSPGVRLPDLIGKAAKLPTPILPADLAPHFTGLPGERLEWQATFVTPLGSGTVAITSRRLLAVQTRKSIRLLPPGLVGQVRRHQHDIAHVTVAESGRGHYPLFLWSALLLVAWFPLGTSFACLALGCYFAMTRAELVIGSAEVRRRYPLSPTEQRSALAALQRLQDRKQAPADGRAAS